MSYWAAINDPSVCLNLYRDRPNDDEGDDLQTYDTAIEIDKNLI